MQDLRNEIKLLDEFFFIMEKDYPRKNEAWQTVKAAMLTMQANIKPKSPCDVCDTICPQRGTGICSGDRSEV